ncbi:hypothetical protein LFE_1835 [Leptospirillum ferrooxidans C2-3]|uniref:Uncharacterized protein n=1 Tax=Leptospirillum ferrooxidans (strain C2-3) TaxID=1162668 RepID=I0IQG4_LEPFC|nr:hypothetical protein LFE_1835 [Leptospirillum ferrooxidans C2-3]
MAPDLNQRDLIRLLKRTGLWSFRSSSRVSLIMVGEIFIPNAARMKGVSFGRSPAIRDSEAAGK